MNKFLLIFVVAMCPVLSGCSTTPKADSWSAKMPWNKKKEPKPYPNPVKMAVTWTPDILVQPGRTPTRGFGGRVYFYNDRSQAVPVEGELTIHGFDEALATNRQSDGVKRFRFTAEQFTTHFSETDLGASYSIWIPWDAAGGDQKKLSLMSTFKTSGGKVVQSEAAMVLLPGRKVDHIAAQRAKHVPVRQVGHFVGDSGTNQGLNASSAMQTTTIPLPSSFQQRLARMPEQSKPSTRTIVRTAPSNQPAAPTPLPTP